MKYFVLLLVLPLLMLSCVLAPLPVAAQAAAPPPANTAFLNATQQQDISANLSYLQNQLQYLRQMAQKYPEENFDIWATKLAQRIATVQSATYVWSPSIPGSDAQATAIAGGYVLLPPNFFDPGGYQERTYTSATPPEMVAQIKAENDAIRNRLRADKSSILIHEGLHLDQGILTRMFVNIGNRLWLTDRSMENQPYMEQYMWLRLFGMDNNSTELISVLNNLTDLGLVTRTGAGTSLADFDTSALDGSLNLTAAVRDLVRDGLARAVQRPRPGTQPATPPSGPQPGVQPGAPSSSSNIYQYLPWYWVYQEMPAQHFGSPDAAASAGLQKIVSGYRNSGSYTKFGMDDINLWSTPTLVWAQPSANHESLYTYMSTFTPYLWDGSYDSARDRVSYNPGGQKVVLIYIQEGYRYPENDYRFFMHGYREDLVTNRPPTISSVSRQGQLLRGQTVTLHADISDPDGDTTSVWWFVDGYSAATGTTTHIGIGIGKDLKWQIPVNLYGSPSLSNFYVAVQDSKGGMGEYSQGMSISGEKEYIDVISVTQSPNPADVGGPVTMTAELGIITPGDIKAVFKVNDQTEVPSTAAVQGALEPNWGTAGRYRYTVSATISTWARGDYVKLYVTNALFGVKLGESYAQTYNLTPSDKDLQEAAKQEQEKKLAQARATLAEVQTAINQLRTERQLFLDFDPGLLSSKMWDVSARAQGYVDWRLGKAQADMAWGTNYTVTLLKDDSVAFLQAALGLSGRVGGIGNDGAIRDALGYQDYTDVAAYSRVRAVSQNRAAVLELVKRYMAYTTKINDLSRKIQNAKDLAAAGQVDAEAATVSQSLDTLAVYLKDTLAVYEVVEEGAAKFPGILAAWPGASGYSSSGSGSTGSSGGGGSGGTPAPRPITLQVNGRPVATDVPPQNINGRVLVPVRFVAEALEADVQWRQNDQTVLVTSKGKAPVDVSTGGGHLRVVVDGREVTGDVPPQNINGRVMVPVRFVSEALKATVGWDGDNQRVIINTAGSSGASTTPSTGSTATPPSSGTPATLTWSEWLVRTSGLNLPWDQDSKSAGNTPWSGSGSEVGYSGWGDGMYHHDFLITQEDFDVSDILVTFEATGSFRTNQGYTGPLIAFATAADMHSSIAADKTLGVAGSYSWESGKQDRGVILYGYGGSGSYQYFAEPFIDYGDGTFRPYSLRIKDGKMTLTTPNGSALTLDVPNVQAGLRLPLVVAMRQYDNGRIYSAQIRNLKVVEHPR